MIAILWREVVLKRFRDSSFVFLSTKRKKQLNPNFCIQRQYILVFCLISIPMMAVTNEETLDSQSLFKQGSDYLGLSIQLQDQVKTHLLDINKLRKHTVVLRQKQKTYNNDNELKLIADDLLVFSDSLHSQSVKLRIKSRDYLDKAKKVFRLGFEQQLSLIGVNDNTNQPKLAYLKNQLTAHNQKVFSKKPQLLEAMEKSNKEKNSQQLLLGGKRLAEQNKPKDLDTHLIQLSNLNNHIAFFSPQTDTIPLNKIHSWYLVVLDVSGQPKEDLHLSIQGDMPGHNHGLATEPKVYSTDLPGVYEVKGMKFQMPGWWVIKFGIDSQPQKEQLIFNLEL